MLTHNLESSPLPEMHDGLLLVRLRTTSRLAGATKSLFESMDLPLTAGRNLVSSQAVPVEDFLRGSKGFSALEYYSRQGLVEEITPLSPTTSKDVDHIYSRSSGKWAALSSMAVSLFASPESQSDPISGGVSFIKLRDGTNQARLARELAQDEAIESVSPVPCRYLMAPTHSGPTRRRDANATAAPPQGGASAMWNLNQIMWSEAKNKFGVDVPETIRIAVLDTGIDENHPDLKGRVSQYHYNHPDLNTPSGPKDIVGHGTHVAGTVAADMQNSIGVAGIADCALSVWKIFDDETTYIPAYNQFVYVVNPVMYRRALAECLASGVNVINLSIGGSGRPDAQEQQLFNALTAQGVAVIAAMGNERRIGSPVSYPAAITDVIAVGATRPDDRVANFSNRGNHIWISAPGVAIWSTLPTYPGQSGFEAVRSSNGKLLQGKPLHRELDYDAWPGTSMATPHVTAATAILLAKKGHLQLDEIRKILADTSDKTSGMEGREHHPDYGYGRLNLLKLLS